MAPHHQHPGMVVDALGNLGLHTQFLFPFYMLKHFPATTTHLAHGFPLLCSLGELLLSLQERLGLWAEDNH